MKKAVTEKSLLVLNYLKDIGDKNVTSADIAEALDMPKKSVDGTITRGLQAKGLTERVPANIEIEDEDGNPAIKNVKFIKLTDAGKEYDHEQAKVEDAEAALAEAKGE